MNIEKDIKLDKFTTLGVGGTAKYFVSITSIEDIGEVISFSEKNNLPIFVLGGGSNVLVSDNGFDGVVIKNNILGIDVKDLDDISLVSVGAGKDWDKFVEFTVLNNLSGIECLSGIPGTVGAAPVQNIGAYGQDVSKTIVEVLAYDTLDKKIVKLDSDSCGFAYRKSIFNKEKKGRYIIINVTFGLKRGGEPEIVYQDLIKYFADKPKPTLKDIRSAVLEIRSRKGMVIHSEFESYKSAGSFFKNPIISKDLFDSVISKVELKDDSTWHWSQPDGSVKVSAAKLIELSGFNKGFKLGNAGISPKHSLSLINLGGAKADDVINLAKTIISGVKEKFNVKIEPEVLLVGFKEDPFRI